MAAGCAALDQLTPEVYEQLEASGATLEHGLRRLVDTNGADASVARVGSLLTLFFGIEMPTHGAAAMHADREAFARFFGVMLDEGVLLPPSGFEAWFISAAHDEADLEQTLEAAGKALAA
jgi:glutamate-1-semialdehyde 2,1-aminomutase